MLASGSVPAHVSPNMGSVFGLLHPKPEEKKPKMSLRVRGPKYKGFRAQNIITLMVFWALEPDYLSPWILKCDFGTFLSLRLLGMEGHLKRAKTYPKGGHLRINWGEGSGIIN